MKEIRRLEENNQNVATVVDTIADFGAKIAALASFLKIEVSYLPVLPAAMLTVRRVCATSADVMITVHKQTSPNRFMRILPSVRPAPIQERTTESLIMTHSIVFDMTAMRGLPKRTESQGYH